MRPTTSAGVEWQVIQALTQLDPGRVLEASEKLNVGDFSSSITAGLFRGVVALSEEGAKIDHLALQEWAERNHESLSLDDIIRAFDFGTIPGEIGRYGKMLRAQSQRRRMRALLETGIRRLDDPAEGVSECAVDIQNALLEIQWERHGARAVRIGDALPDLLNQMAAERAGTSGLIGLSTGVPDLDDVTTGIRRGEVWVVGALPGRGKTAFGLQVACANAFAGKVVVVLSLEMSMEQNLRRIVSHAAQTNAFCVRDPRLLNVTAWTDLVEKAAALREWPLIIDDSANLTGKQLVNRMRLYVRRFKADLLVLDYIQIVQGAGRDLRERVGTVANLLRIVAKEERVPIVVLSQLTRPADINEPPTMTKLKESGDIEANAHVVLLLYQPIDKQTHRPTGEDQIIIGKQRNGPLAEIPVVFDGRTMTFRPRMVGRL